jgi:hypothetical protein
LGAARGSRVYDEYKAIEQDLKQKDARKLLERFANDNFRQDAKKIEFPNTQLWRLQFEAQLGELPPGNVDPFD